MSAQTPSQSVAGSEQRRAQNTGLARRSAVPSLPSLLLDPFGFFDDSPFSMLRRLQQDVARNAGSSGRSSNDLSSLAWAPPIEVNYRDGNLEVAVELPGIANEDVNVEIDNNVLVIQGERKEEQEKTEGGIRRTERRYGQFYRAVTLPDGADAANARAEFDNGVLRITIPVPQAQSDKRQIPVKASTSSQSSQSGTSSQSSQSGRSSQGGDQPAAGKSPSSEKAA